jgi:hypothetical protein
MREIKIKSTMRHNTYTRMAIMKTNKKKEEKKNNK